jgi:peroxiredoxin
MRASFQWFVRLLLVCCLLFAIHLPNAAWGERILQVTEGDQAYNFTLQDLNGHKVRLSDYKGRTVLLFFMTTWIRDCEKMIPDLKEMHSNYGSKGLVIFNIDVSESRKRAARFSKEHDIPYQTLLDSDGKAALKYGVFGVPVVVLINGESGIICWDCPSVEKLNNLLEKQFERKE